MNIQDFKNLKQIHEYFAVHNTCKLKNTATQPVYEIEPPKSGIVFIGEAPGRNEDKEGKPFVGAAGKFLNELLRSIGYTRRDVYVTNVVKYRPPDNRDPLPEEKKDCRVWVNAELIFLKPKVIIPLGRHALETFIPNQQISLVHGKVYIHSSGIPVFAMYHPAAALYNPNLRQILAKDFLILKEFLDGKISPQGTDDLAPEEAVNQKEKQSVIDEILKM